MADESQVGGARLVGCTRRQPPTRAQKRRKDVLRESGSRVDAKQEPCAVVVVVVVGVVDVDLVS